MSTLKNQIALVTGGNRGIGRAISIAFAAAGANVIVNYQNRAEEASGVAAEIQKLGRRCAVIQADVSQSPEVDRLVTDAEKQVGGITILVNNAGIARPQP